MIKLVISSYNKDLQAVTMSNVLHNSLCTLWEGK